MHDLLCRLFAIHDGDLNCTMGTGQSMHSGVHYRLTSILLHCLSLSHGRLVPASVWGSTGDKRGRVLCMSSATKAPPHPPAP